MSSDKSPDQSVIRSPPVHPIETPKVAASMSSDSGGGEGAFLDGWQVVRHRSKSDSGETKNVALNSSDLVSWSVAVFTADEQKASESSERAPGTYGVSCGNIVDS